MIDSVYRHCGQKETVIFCRPPDGRSASITPARAGISFGKDDIVIPDDKVKLVSRDHAGRCRRSTSSSTRTA